MKHDFPQFYGTHRHLQSLAKKTVTSLDHALKADIYFIYPSIREIEADKTVRPMRLFLSPIAGTAVESIGEPTGAAHPETPEVPEMSAETIAKLEVGVGTLYILGTQTYTKAGDEILKIGTTAGSVEQRIRQLYTTSVATPFRVVLQLETKNYAELEKALHHLLDPFRINRSREYFTDRCLPFVESVLKIHLRIQDAARPFSSTSSAEISV